MNDWYIQQYKDPLVRAEALAEWCVTQTGLLPVVPRQKRPHNKRLMLDTCLFQVSGKPSWFIGCGYFELLVQVPFFAVAVYGYALNREWIRLPNLVFSSASAAVMIPIMSELVLSSHEFEKSAVLAMYCPFAIMPIFIATKTFLALRQELNSSTGRAAFAQGKKD